jgi:hypothetical protein
MSSIAELIQWIDAPRSYVMKDDGEYWGGDEYDWTNDLKKAKKYTSADEARNDIEPDSEWPKSARPVPVRRRIRRKDLQALASAVGDLERERERLDNKLTLFMDVILSVVECTGVPSIPMLIEEFNKMKRDRDEWLRIRPEDRDNVLDMLAGLEHEPPSNEARNAAVAVLRNAAKESSK